MEHFISDKVEKCISAILQHDVGRESSTSSCSSPEIPLLSSAVHKLIKYWNHTFINKLQEEYCSHNSKDSNELQEMSRYSEDKCQYAAEEAFIAVHRGPVATGSSLEAIHCLLNSLDVKKKKIVRESAELQIHGHNVSNQSFSTDEFVSTTSKSALIRPHRFSKRAASSELPNAVMPKKKKQKREDTLSKDIVLEHSLLSQEIALTSSEIDKLNIKFPGMELETQKNYEVAKAPNPTSFKMLPPIPIRCVLKFINVVVCRFIPLELFGSQHNRRHFIRNYKKVIATGANDDFYLGDLLLNIKIGHCK